MLVDEPRELGTVRRARLAEDRRDLVLHGRTCGPEHARDLGVRQPADDVVDDLALARAEPEVGRRGRDGRVMDRVAEREDGQRRAEPLELSTARRVR